METTEEAILAELKEAGPETAKEVAVNTGIPEGTVRRHLHRLHNTGRIESDDYQRDARVWMLP